MTKYDNNSIDNLPDVLMMKVLVAWTGVVETPQAPRSNGGSEEHAQPILGRRIHHARKEVCTFQILQPF